MSGITDKLIGVSDEVLAHPKVAAAIASADAAENGADVSVVATEPEPDLTKWGITLRSPGLGQQTLLLRIASALSKHGLASEGKSGVSMDIPDAFQPFLWTWLLGAPLPDVYRGIHLLESKGLPDLEAYVQEWFDKLGVPAEAMGDIMKCIRRSLELSRLAAGVQASAEPQDKKKHKRRLARAHR